VPRAVVGEIGSPPRVPIGTSLSTAVLMGRRRRSDYVGTLIIGDATECRFETFLPSSVVNVYLKRTADHEPEYGHRIATRHDNDAQRGCGA